MVLKSIALKDEPVLKHTVDKLLIRKPYPQGHNFESVQAVELYNDVSQYDNVKLLNNGGKYVWTEIAPKNDEIQVNYPSGNQYN